MKTRKRITQIAGLAGICATLATATTHGAIIIWQGGSGAFTDANWNVDGTPSQTHGSFGADDDTVIKNTTISGGTVTGFNWASVGRIGFSDSLLISGGASIFGDYLDPAKNHSSDITLQEGTITLSNLNALRSSVSPFEGLVNFTGAAGAVSLVQTDNSGSTNQELAGKISSASGTNSYFRIDGTLVTTNGVSYNGTNLAAINTELASNVVNGRYFQIDESGNTQTLNLVAVPEPSAALLGSLGVLLLLRRRR